MLGHSVMYTVSTPPEAETCPCILTPNVQEALLREGELQMGSRNQGLESIGGLEYPTSLVLIVQCCGVIFQKRHHLSYQVR